MQHLQIILNYTIKRSVTEQNLTFGPHWSRSFIINHLHGYPSSYFCSSSPRAGDTYRSDVRRSWQSSWMSGRQVQPSSRLPVPAPVPPILSHLRHSSFPQPRDGCLPETCAHKKQPVSRVISPRYRLPSIRISQVFSD